jgi:hypothetical protein
MRLHAIEAVSLSSGWETCWNRRIAIKPHRLPLTVLGLLLSTRSGPRAADCSHGYIGSRGCLSRILNPAVSRQILLHTS